MNRLINFPGPPDPVSGSGNPRSLNSARHASHDSKDSSSNNLSRNSSNTNGMNKSKIVVLVSIK